MSQKLFLPVVQEMSTIPTGMEVIWQKTRILDSNSREVIHESETGQIDNHVHQRAARPWTYLGPNEPYIYEYRMVHDVMPTGHLADIIQILRTPNWHKQTKPILGHVRRRSKRPVFSPGVASILRIILGM